MTSWTSVTDVTTRWVGEDAFPYSAAQIQIFIDDMEARVLKRFPLIQNRIDSNLLPLRLVQQVVANAIVDVAQLGVNGAYASVSESVGPFSKAVSIVNAARRDLKLTQDDIVLLSPQPANGLLIVTVGGRYRYNPGTNFPYMNEYFPDVLY